MCCYLEGRMVIAVTVLIVISTLIVSCVYGNHINSLQAYMFSSIAINTELHGDVQ